ncbi:MAG: carbamate kinase [Betaproteobacteria bacterium]
MSTIVLALGGNAILRPGQKGTFAEQYTNVELACSSIPDLLKAGHRVVITHGNGPQVGHILIQNEESRHSVPPLPLDACGAESQGLIGYMLQQCLRNHLRAVGLAAEVATIITQVEVDAADPSFAQPTKPIGPFYATERATKLREQSGQQFVEDAGRGWRRVVPSPQPQGIVEREVIKRFLAEGWVVIACGGGGIPVVRNREGRLSGVEAVVDKDLAAERLARDVNADLLLLLTDVPQVYLNYRKPNQTALTCLTAAEGRRYQAEGHFVAGSMGPKIEAALRFVESGQGMAIIGSLETLAQTLAGQSGTRIVA